ncbi:Uncharacterised protein [uncultured archaeon]|nr:Uncharacterised protein [uncultured archaeon]
MQDITERIEKDIRMFQDSIEKMRGVELSAKEKEVYDLAVDYCSDAGAWLKKNDAYTSFASIS